MSTFKSDVEISPKKAEPSSGKKTHISSDETSYSENEVYISDNYSEDEYDIT